VAEVVVMPQLGNTVESCVVTSWHIKVGDEVNPSTIAAQIETDKSAMEVPAGVSGTVLRLLAEPGDEVAVKAGFFIVGEPGEAIDDLIPASTETPQPKPTLTQPIRHTPPPATPAPTQTRTTASPRARREANQAGIDIAAIRGTGPQGRILASDVRAAIEAIPPPPVGTGLGGRLTRADLAGTNLIHAPMGLPTPPVPQVPQIPQPPPAQSDFPGAFTDTEITGIRKLVAERMQASLAHHAQITETASAPATALLALRARLNNQDLPKITLGDLLAYAAVRTVADFPVLNSTFDGTTLRSFSAVHLGLAVDTVRGLLVPTIRFSSTMGLHQFAVASKELITQARTGTINPDLLTGATFSLTNLGAYGIESFTPILNSPQVAILGVNAITPSAVVNPDGSIGVEQRISFSLTVDHAVVDGADAARFLQALTAFITDIDRRIDTETGLI